MNICCICKKEFKSHSNNAEPFKKGECCDKCNNEFVIPSRLLELTIITNEQKKLIKELRGCTGVNMIEAKTALFKNNWNIEKAIEWIRWHGLC